MLHANNEVFSPFVSQCALTDIEIKPDLILGITEYHQACENMNEAREFPGLLVEFKLYAYAKLKTLYNTVVETQWGHDKCLFFSEFRHTYNTEMQQFMAFEVPPYIATMADDVMLPIETIFSTSPGNSDRLNQLINDYNFLRTCLNHQSNLIPRLQTRVEALRGEPINARNICILQNKLTGSQSLVRTMQLSMQISLSGISDHVNNNFINHYHEVYNEQAQQLEQALNIQLPRLMLPPPANAHEGIPLRVPLDMEAGLDEMQRDIADQYPNLRPRQQPSHDAQDNLNSLNRANKVWAVAGFFGAAAGGLGGIAAGSVVSKKIAEEATKKAVLYSATVVGAALGGTGGGVLANRLRPG